MLRKQKPTASTNPTAPAKAISAELLAKAYRLAKQSEIPAAERKAPAMSLDDIVALSQTPESRAETRAFVRRRGHPLYSEDPKYPGLIIETSSDGSRRIGRLVNRKFVE